MLAARYLKKVTGVEPKSPPGGQLKEILCAAIRLNSGFEAGMNAFRRKKQIDTLNILKI